MRRQCVEAKGFGGLVYRVLIHVDLGARVGESRVQCGARRVEPGGRTRRFHELPPQANRLERFELRADQAQDSMDRSGTLAVNAPVDGVAQAVEQPDRRAGGSSSNPSAFWFSRRAPDFEARQASARRRLRARAGRNSGPRPSPSNRRRRRDRNRAGDERWPPGPRQ